MTEAITEVRDGVRVIKHIEADEYNLPSVVYEFTSEREEELTVRVVESTETALDRENIGTHQEFEPDTWGVPDDELEFEAGLEPEADRKVVFALRPPDAVELEQFGDIPDSITVTPERETVVRRGTSANAPPTANSTDTEDPDETESPTRESNRVLDLDRTPEERDTISSNGDSRSDVQEDEPTDNGEDNHLETESVVSQFVAELRAGRVSQEELEYLEQQFGTSGHDSSSVDARIKQLQTDFSDLRAYTSALEGFLNENGSAREILDSLEERLESVESDVESLESTVVDHESELSVLREDQQGVRSDVDSLTSTIESLEDDFEEVSAEVSHVKEQIPASNIDDRLADIEDDISKMKTFTSRLQGALQEGVPEDSQ
jgi:archaellum component FlaC